MPVLGALAGVRTHRASWEAGSLHTYRPETVHLLRLSLHSKARSPSGLPPAPAQ